MRYLPRIFVVAAVALAFTACYDALNIFDPNGSQPGDMKVNVTFSLTDKAVQTKSMVSGTETQVTVMQLVCFDANSQYLGIRTATVSSNGASGTFFDTGKISGTVPPGTSHIHFIANRSLTEPLSFVVGAAEETVMKSLELSTAYDDTDHQMVCYWGYHKEANATAMKDWLNPAEGSNHVVYMIRDRAKVVLSYDKTGAPVEVTKIEWLIHNGRARGYLAPASSDWWDDENNVGNYYGNSTVTGHTSELIATAGLNEYTGSDRYSLWTSATDNEEDNFDLAYQSSGTYTSQPQFLFDDKNGDDANLKVILKVTYQREGEDPETVYHTLRLNDDDKVKYEVIRNNTYYIKCKLLSPDIACYETLEEAVDGDEFVNADVEVDRSITEINDETYTLQILLTSETTATVLNTLGNHELHFAFRLADNVSEPGSTDPDDFNVYWEYDQNFCSDPVLTYDGDTKQFVITTEVLEGHLTSYLQDEWIVVEHKDSGLKRYIHVFVINQFRYRINPTLTKAGNDYLLSFQLPPVEHSQFITDEGGNVIPDPNELIYPESLYPIDVKFATNTLNAYGIAQGTTNYGYFGVSVESTQPLCYAANFETGFNSPISSTATTDITHWYYQQAFNYWDFWYTYSLKSYPTDGVVNIYLKDVRDNINYADVEDVGLFMYVEYFGKNYSVPGPQ